MKEKIYTIPVNDAYAAPGPCPLCSLETTMTRDLVDYYLGPALMEPDIRKVTNEKGFCREHLTQLYNREENRLGLGLILHTHTSDLVADLGAGLRQSTPGGNAGLLRGQQKDFRKNLFAMADRIDQRTRSCIICERLDYTMDRYLDVILHQYFTDPAFKSNFDAGSGYCLPHVALLLRGAARYLNQNQAAEFVGCLSGIQNHSLENLRDDVEWFTLKFDYRNHQKDWKNSKDALPRAIRKLSGESNLK
jgi:hypothetical protein